MHLFTMLIFVSFFICATQETSTGKWNFIHFMAHGIHHLCPTDPSRLTFPPVFSVFVGAAFYYPIVSGFGPGFSEVRVM